MTIIERNVSVENFPAWSGGKDTLDKIIEADKVNQFDAMIEELYPDGITRTELNDILWFDEELPKFLGIEEED